MPLGTHTITRVRDRSAGARLRMKWRSICSAISKSAITPWRSGRVARDVRRRAADHPLRLVADRLHAAGALVDRDDRRLEQHDALAAPEHDACSRSRGRRRDRAGRAASAATEEEKAGAEQETPRPSLATARLSGRQGAPAPEDGAPAPDAPLRRGGGAQPPGGSGPGPAPRAAAKVRRHPLTTVAREGYVQPGIGGNNICASISFETMYLEIERPRGHSTGSSSLTSRDFHSRLPSMDQSDHVDHFMAQFSPDLELDPEVEGIVDRIGGLSRRIKRTAEQTIAEFGLGYGEWHLLGEAAQRGPATRTLSDPQAAGALERAMTNRLDGLEKAGLVRRLPDLTTVGPCWSS